MNSRFDNLYLGSRRLNLILHLERKTIQVVPVTPFPVPDRSHFCHRETRCYFIVPVQRLSLVSTYFLDLMQVQLSNLSRLGTKFPFPLPASHSSIATIHREMLYMDPVGRATDASCRIPYDIAMSNNLKSSVHHILHTLNVNLLNFFSQRK